MSSKLVYSTPYELRSGQKPSPTRLRPWGSVAYIHDPFSKFINLGPRGKKCDFIRYSKHSKGNLVIWVIGEQTNKNISKLKSQDAKFLENDFPQFNLFYMLKVIIRNFILV